MSDQTGKSNGTDYDLQLDQVRAIQGREGVFRVIPNLAITLNPNFEFPPYNPYNTHTILHTFRPELALSKETLDQFDSLGLKSSLRDVQLFLTQGPYVGDLHTDGTDPTWIEGAINWVYRDPTPSYWRFEYWLPRDGTALTQGRQSDLKGGPGSGTFPLVEDCDFLAQWTSPCSQPTLVRVNIPHRILVEAAQLRLLFSIRFHVDQVNFWDLDRILPR